MATLHSESKPAFSSTSCAKLLRLAEVLDQCGSITASTVIQRINREAMWGLHSSLGISGSNGSMLLHLEGFVSYHSYDDGGEDKDIYRGTKFNLGNVRLELDNPPQSPKQPSGLDTPESISTSYSNSTLTSSNLHSATYSPLSINPNVDFSIQHGASFHALPYHKPVTMSPSLHSSFAHEDQSGRKRSRGSNDVDETDTDQLDELYIDEEEDINLQRLQLHTGDLRPVPHQQYIPYSSQEGVPHMQQNMVLPSYPPKVHKIGTSRPRKKQSPCSPASSSGMQIVAEIGSESSTTKRKTGMSLVERVWHGIYEGTKLSKQFGGDIGLDIVQVARTVSLQLRSLGTNTPVTQKAFQDINTNCSALYSSTCSFRILDLIMQAIWVDLFHARVATLALEPQNQYNSPTDNNILALKESKAVFGCSEKEMRNKLAIWSGYKRIKDIGGWPALIFAEEGGGVYNVCKYRGGGWKDGIFEELEKLRDAIELAADTLQPEWRRLLEALFGGDETPPRGTWEGQHPHAWVVGIDGVPIPLSNTYRDGLEYELIETSVVDDEAWPDMDPRRVAPERDDELYMCDVCKETQSEEMLGNKCLCFPDLYGGNNGRRGGKYVPVQIYRTETKGNGLIARLPIPAGAGVGEFSGTVTRGLRGVDVMEGGVEPNKYQISQSRQGNFTRFINHSCNPNTHFQVFVWRGIERIIIVSRGVKAGAEITVDYSNGYWEGLDKACKCEEEQCRYPHGSAVVYPKT